MREKNSTHFSFASQDTCVCRSFQSITRWLLLEILQRTTRLSGIALISENSLMLITTFEYRGWSRALNSWAQATGQPHALGAWVFCSYPCLWDALPPFPLLQLAWGRGRSRVMVDTQSFLSDQSLLSFRKPIFSFFLVLGCFFCPDSLCPIQLRSAIYLEAFMTSVKCFANYDVCRFVNFFPLRAQNSGWHKLNNQWMCLQLH